MTHQIRPSDGKVAAGAHIDLNAKAFRPGEEVLFKGAFGWAVAGVERVTGNSVLVAGQVVDVREIAGRLTQGVDRVALVAIMQRLEADYTKATRLAHRILLDRRAEILSDYHIA